MTALIPNCWRQLFYRSALLFLCGLFLPALSGCAPKGQVIDERALFDISAEFYSDGTCEYVINGVSSRGIGPLRRAKDSTKIGFYEEMIVIFDICRPEWLPILTVSSDDGNGVFDDLWGRWQRDAKYVDGPPNTTKTFPIKSSSKLGEYRVEVYILIIKDFLEQYQLEPFTKYRKRVFFCDDSSVEMIEGTLTYFGEEERSKTKLDYSLAGRAKIVTGPCP